MSKPNLRQLRNPQVAADETKNLSNGLVLQPFNATPPPIPKPSPSCSNCFHFHKNIGSPQSGTCHRNPPAQGLNYINCRSWPPMIGTDLCGEWFDRNLPYFEHRWRLQDASRLPEGVKAQPGA